MNFLLRFAGTLSGPGTRAATTILALVVLTFASGRALGVDPEGIYITKFCSDTGNNQHFEFVQITNLGTTPVSMSGWSQDDSNAKPFQHSLSGLGTLQPGQSGVVTEATPSNFETYWWGSPANAPSGFKAVQYTPTSGDNLSTSADSVTLFDASGTLVDQIAYVAPKSGDATVRNAPLDAVGLNNNTLWVNSALGDQFGSFRASGISPFAGIIGNPAVYMIPEPGSLSIFGMTLGLLLIRRRRVSQQRHRSPRD